MSVWRDLASRGLPGSSAAQGRKTEEIKLFQWPDPAWGCRLLECHQEVYMMTWSALVSRREGGGFGQQPGRGLAWQEARTPTLSGLLSCIRGHLWENR